MYRIQDGSDVKKGDLLIEFDREGILGEGYDITIPVIVTNTGDYAQVNTQAAGSVKAGEPVLSCVK